MDMMMMMIVRTILRYIDHTVDLIQLNDCEQTVDIVDDHLILSVYILDSKS